MLEILTLSIAGAEKLLDKASSSFLHLNTQLSTPATAEKIWKALKKNDSKKAAA